MRPFEQKKKLYTPNIVHNTIWFMLELTTIGYALEIKTLYYQMYEFDL